ncbi:SusC/RagA family TonB-linked outer membrane protein [Dyadobacter psychrotolerans]|uniref:TonB-dependent receptor n=1 Tax=Dyadobacter psychrotolerans TaxID=2541721 RepID=A0A4V2Z593_9BACT|nr:TonB-dependent receptor [Dyadobacter psychrotolerans]TDE18628.1 TonB-dependent receptor [Dyadobacter psychrotolerans]
MKKALLFTFFGVFGMCLSLFAQDIRITGKVTSAEDESNLAGATVVEKGSTNGTQTDSEGKYSLSVKSSASVLIFSFVGTLTKEIPVGSQSVINAQLSADTRSLEEVVVTGFGSQIKRDLTGNIAQIKSKDIENMPVASVDAALQGRAAGVYINSGSGKLGEAPIIRVRGSSSISASSQPLYVVDGMPIISGDQSNYGSAMNPLTDINPNDIESIEILKDASAGAIYGSRAANGVILITTKRGGAGKTKMSLNYQAGVAEATKRVKFLNAEQYVDFYTKAAATRDRISGYETDDPDSYTQYMIGEGGFLDYQSFDTFTNGTYKNYSWQDEAFQKGPMQQVDFQMNGGNEKTKFFISGQYYDQKGTLIGNSLNRMSARLNVDHQAYKWLTVGMSMGLSRTDNRRLPGDNQFSNPLQAAALVPLTPITDPNTGLPTGTPPGDVGLPLYYNPRISIDYSKFQQIGFRNLTNAYAQINFSKDFRFRSEIGIDLLNQNEEGYYQTQTLRNVSTAVNGQGDNYGSFVTNYNTNNFLTYDKLFDVHSINLTAGMTYQESQRKVNWIQGTQFPSDLYQKIASAATKSDGTSTETNFRFLSYFLRANYKFADKYLLSVSGRVDGSSRFGVNSRYGFFPAASAGWVITEENFLKQVDILSFLKLRASYGLTGNSEIGDFPQLGLYSGDAGYAGAAGQRPSQIANPDLKWELTHQTDIGIDFGILNNRINGEIDYYVKKTSGLLLNVQVPATSGFSTQVKNVGKMNNKGWELVINSQNIVGAFKWNTSFNISTNKNKVVSVPEVIQGGQSSMSRVMEGQPVGVFYTVEYAGVDPANGDALFYKNTENPDGTIDRSTVNNANYNQAQRVAAGNPNPKFQGGISNDISYKGFDFNIFFNGVTGNKINFFGVGQYSSANGIYEDNQTVDQLNSWTPTNTNTDVPEARFYRGNGNQASTRYIYDGAFLRLRSMTLGYTIPKSITSKIKLERLRVYVSAMNLATFTKYKGWDPEVNSGYINSGWATGNDFYTPPQPRTILAGINLSF